MTRKKLQHIIRKTVFESSDLTHSDVERLVSIISASTRHTLWGLTLLQACLLKRRRQQTLFIESAIDLGNNDLSTLQKSLAKNYRIHDVNYSKDADLLGGMRLRINDWIVDSTLQTQIRLLSERIARSQ